MKKRVLRLVLLSLAWGLCLATWPAAPALAGGTLVLARGGESNSLDPGEAFTFGILITAQALGDRQALLDAGRRVLRLHIGGNLHEGLRRLGDAIG